MLENATAERWLRSEARGSHRSLALAVGLSVMGGLLVLLQASLLAGIASAVITGGASLPAVATPMVALLAIYGARYAVTALAERISSQVAANIKKSLRGRLLQRLEALGPAWLRTQHSGELITSIVDGVDAMEGYHARYLPQMGAAALVPLALLVFIAPRDWFSAAVLLLTAPLIPLFMYLVGKGAERLNQKQWLTLQRIGGRLLDAIQGLTTLKLLNASRREVAVVARLSDGYRRTTMVVLRVAFLSSLVLEFFATVSIAVVAVFIGFRLYGYFDWAPISFETGLFVLLLAPEFYLPLRDLGSRYHARMEAIGAAEGILHILQAPTRASAGSGQENVPAGPFTLTLHDVHYTYPGERTALRGVDLTIKPGEQLALVGVSGAGKSTLAHLLLGFLTPDRGTLRVGDLDLAAIRPDAWLSAVAWVPQRPQLLHGTLLDNIQLGRPSATPEEASHAAALAGAGDFIAALPDGLQTMVGERGQGLSGGELQRIALARAFLRDARLVVLDEPTANLDPVAEATIGAALRSLARERAVVVIAHRWRTAASADRIAVLDAGRVVECGAPDELMRRDGAFARMTRAAEAER